MHACIQTNNLHTYIHIYMHPCTNINMHTCIHTCSVSSDTYILLYMHACAHTYIHTYMHTCIHPRTYVCMYVLAMTRCFQQRFAKRFVWFDVAAWSDHRCLLQLEQAAREKRRSAKHDGARFLKNFKEAVQQVLKGVRSTPCCFVSLQIWSRPRFKPLLVTC